MEEGRSSELIVKKLVEDVENTLMISCSQSPYVCDKSLKTLFDELRSPINEKYIKQLDIDEKTRYYFEVIAKFYGEHAELASQRLKAYTNLFSNLYFPLIFALIYYRAIFHPKMDTTVYFLNVFLTGANRLFWSDVESQHHHQPASRNYDLGNFPTDIHNQTSENGSISSKPTPTNNILTTSEDSVNIASVVKNTKKSEKKDESSSTSMIVIRNKRFDYQRIFYYMKHVLLSEDKIPCLDSGVVNSKSLLLPDNNGTGDTSSLATFPYLSYYSDIISSSGTNNGSSVTAATTSENFMISMNKENTMGIVFKYYFYYHKSLKFFDKFLNNLADRECRLNPLLLGSKEQLVTFFYDLFVKETNIMLQSIVDESSLLKYLAGLNFINIEKIGAKTKLKLQDGLYLLTRPGQPIYPSRKVRHEATSTLDKLFPKGRLARFYLGSWFRIFHQVTWPKSVFLYIYDTTVQCFKYPFTIVFGRSNPEPDTAEMMAQLEDEEYPIKF